MDREMTRNNYQIPYTIVPVEKEINDMLLNDFTGESTGYVQVGEEKWLYSRKFCEVSKHIYNFAVRPDDTWIITFPRSGTTCTQEILWLLANNLDYEGAAKNPLSVRFPFLDFTLFFDNEIIRQLTEENAGNPEAQSMIKKFTVPGWEILEKMESPRFIKTHLPISVLPPNLLTSGCKIIYVARNPKDVSVSFYHLHRLWRTLGFSSDFPRFWNYFQNNLVAWSPYWSHVKEGWKYRNHPRVKFVFFEDTCQNLLGAIKSLAEFLNKSYSDKELAKLAEHLSIDNFRKNPSVNFNEVEITGVLNTDAQTFIRKGKIGDWSDEFTAELNKQADQWITDNLKNTDLKFPGVKNSPKNI